MKNSRVVSELRQITCKYRPNYKFVKITNHNYKITNFTVILQSLNTAKMRQINKTVI